MALRNKLRYIQEFNQFFFYKVVKYIQDILHIYPRFRINSIGSVFTTNDYRNSPKRIHYCGLFENGHFDSFDTIACFKFQSSEKLPLSEKIGFNSKQACWPKSVHFMRRSQDLLENQNLIYLSRYCYSES